MKLVLLFIFLLFASIVPGLAAPLPPTVDCSGRVDSTVAYQAAVDAMPDTGSLWHPVGCKILLGTGASSGQCGITINSRVGVQFISDVLIGNFGGGGTPQFLWNGHGGTVFCVNSTDHPRFIGLAFQVTDAGNMDSCITFDGNPTTHIGTNGVVHYVVCNNGSNNNPSFVGISIAPTATNNHENYEISHLYVACSGAVASVRARDGITVAGSPNVSSVGSGFTVADVGQPINISYPGRNLQTTVASVVDGQHVVLSASVPEAASQATIITGQSYGIGLQNGADQNAIQQTFSRITYWRCHTGIRLAGGNAELSHINGGQSDTGILVGWFVAEQVAINWYESESDLRGIDSAGPLVMITNSRFSNGNQYADGFFRFGGVVNLQNSFLEFNPPPGAVLIGKNPTNNPTITSTSNYWNVTWQQLGYDLLAQPPPTVINDLSNGGAPGQFVFGCWGGNMPCVQISNIVGHAGGAALQVVSGAQFSDFGTPVVGIQIKDTLWLVGSYEAISASASAGRITNENVPLHLMNVPIVDPHKAGALWNNGGVLSVSGG